MSKIDVYQKGRGRTPKIVSEERDKLVAELLMQGMNRAYITKYCVDNFGIAESSVNRQIHRSNNYIRKNYQEDAEVVVNKHMAMYYDLYANFKEYDGSTAIKALNSIEKLLKLHNPETLVQQNTLNLNLDKLSINELKELLNNED